MQNHLAFTYCRVQASPLVLNVIVPVPDDFHPALVTVITMVPTSGVYVSPVGVPAVVVIAPPPKVVESVTVVDPLVAIM
jgi:hypothetical protein